MARVPRLELGQAVLETAVLPITPHPHLVLLGGTAPPYRGSQPRTLLLGYSSIFGPGAVHRTPDLPHMKRTLSPTELHRDYLAPLQGVEPQSPRSKRGILPLNERGKMVGHAGADPASSV